ncbi:hypothetical protein KKE26_04230 [bacterium]|nr:hypothetical protein [bacterium]
MKHTTAEAQRHRDIKAHHKDTKAQQFSFSLCLCASVPLRLYSLRKVMGRTAFLFILLTITSQAYAETGAEVLRFPIGARANGMAGAQAAVANGIDAICCNPACLAKCWYREAIFSCIDGPMDTSVSSILYGQPTQKGYLAGGLTCLNGGKSPIYWKNGTVEDIHCQSDWVAIMAYGHQITENGCMGYGLKIITSKLAERETAVGCGLDMGWLYRKGKFSAAMAVANAGIGLKYQKKRDNLPLCLRFGMAGEVYARKSNSLLLTGDLVKYKNEDLGLVAGLEYNYEIYYSYAQGTKLLTMIIHLVWEEGLGAVN